MPKFTKFRESSLGPDLVTDTFSRLQKQQLDNSEKYHDTSKTDSVKMYGSTEAEKKAFEFILDCCDIEVTRVEALQPTMTRLEWLELFSRDLNDSAEKYLKLSKDSFNTGGLLHRTDKWSLRIWDPNIYSPKDFPQCIKIHYTTKAEGSSLRWAVDQDGDDCVYTAGMWVNNRSLMPCQEYGSLSTWQAIIRVPSESIVVLMSGDEEPCVTPENQLVEYYYKSRMPLPSFSLALAIGHWQCAVVAMPGSGEVDCGEKGFNENRCNDSVGFADPGESDGPICVPKSVTVKYPYLQKTCLHNLRCQIPYCEKPQLPCRIFAPSSLLPRAVAEFKSAIRQYSVAVQKLLGPCPFPRMDIVFYPPCSQDMAMSNPNLLFLSQSVVAGDGSMCVRLGHELSHYWFGLLLGARDWTEEWLSEGFATFAEDIIEASARGWSSVEQNQQTEMAAYLRYVYMHLM